MPEFIRALAYIIVLSVPTFMMMKAPLLKLEPRAQPVAWAGIWMALTISLFLSRNFWIFMMLVVLITFFSQKWEKDRIVLFMLLFVAAPPVLVAMRGFGSINNLFVLSYQHYLAVLLLLPLLLSRNKDQFRTGLPFFLIFSYVLLVAVLFLRETTITNSLRHSISLILMSLVPFWVLSTRITKEEHMRVVITALLFGLMPVTLMAFFEFVRGWHLYASSGNWVDASYGGREGLLRASASMLAPIPLGTIMMASIMLAAGLPIDRLARVWRFLLFASLVLGLIASLSRGPWIGGLVGLIVFLLTGKSAVKNLLKFLGVGAIAIMLALVSPAGDKIYRLIPFVGKADETSESTEEYRVRLLENSLIVINRHPILGSVDYLNEPELQEMIQGEGIIDIVNTYLQVALETGLVGLMLFVSFFGSIVSMLARVIWSMPDSEASLKRMLRGLLAAMVGVLFTIFTVSSVSITAYLYWTLAGLCVGGTHIGRARLRTIANGRQKAPHFNPIRNVTRPEIASRSNTGASWPSHSSV